MHGLFKIPQNGLVNGNTTLIERNRIGVAGFGEGGVVPS